ncbi:FAD-dependent oxidoreductase [Virgibacillus necropolis]|uniref:FAD/NAD(P)-binding domain-containing protein n=1 Tax=Virgibacillus necropolis TaxID=163877 RepID=A0A221MCI6_9BACI|nr:hypothetical protein CFK40_10150 [Virgibacillus necropolis]
MFDVLIVGAGPAGTSAALFTAKNRKKTMVIDNEKSVTKRAWIKNYYGVKKLPALIKSKLVKTRPANLALKSSKLA